MSKSELAPDPLIPKKKSAAWKTVKWMFLWLFMPITAFQKLQELGENELNEHKEEEPPAKG